jgi:hypothetical protein
MLPEQIRILKPDAIVFFTGLYYDNALETTFPGAEWIRCGDWKLPLLLRVKHDELPKATYRTYPPGYLRRSKRFDVIDTIARQIQADFQSL